jgi:hypothetical protein
MKRLKRPKCNNSEISEIFPMIFWRKFYCVLLMIKPANQAPPFQTGISSLSFYKRKLVLLYVKSDIFIVKTTEQNQKKKSDSESDQESEEQLNENYKEIKEISQCL